MGLKYYKNKSILITGANGYIGSSLTNFFLNIRCNIKLLDKKFDKDWFIKKPQAKYIKIKADICKIKTWQKVLSKVDFVFHLAALEYNRNNFDIFKDWQINTKSVINLLEVCRQKKFRPKIIFSSSANIFGLIKKMPVSEKEKSLPLSLWSVHKLMAENYLRVYSKKYNIKSIILRLANVYGPSANLKANNNVVLNKIVDSALKERNLKLYRNQQSIRDFIYIDDVVKAFVFAGLAKKLLFDGSFYIIGSGEGKTIREIWHLIAKKIKSKNKNNILIKLDKHKKLEPFDFRNFVADSSCFQKKTGWQASTSFNKGLEQTINYFYIKNGKKDN